MPLVRLVTAPAAVHAAGDEPLPLACAAIATLGTTARLSKGLARTAPGLLAHAPTKMMLHPADRRISRQHQSGYQPTASVGISVGVGEGAASVGISRRQSAGARQHTQTVRLIGAHHGRQAAHTVSKMPRHIFLMVIKFITQDTPSSRWDPDKIHASVEKQ